MRSSSVSVGSAPEPSNEDQSQFLKAHVLYVLSTKTISDEVSVLFPLWMFALGGDAIGEENIPLTGSNPNSSRTPVSAKVIPVFLRRCQ